jgi:hypothetical protein
MGGGDMDDGPASDIEVTGSGLNDDRGSADIVGSEDCSVLVFSTPDEVMLDEAGKLEVMGVVEGMTTSLRRPLCCEPAPTVVPLFASRLLISTAMWD